MDSQAAETIRDHTENFLRTVDDPDQAREVRAFACQVVGWGLFYVKDERLFADVFAVLRRAIDRDDEPPLLLLSALGASVTFDQAVVAGLVRLGEHALNLGRTTALARISRSLTSRPRLDGDTVKVPPRWVRALVGTASPEEVSGEVLSAVGPWLRDKHGDVESVRDMLGDPEAWIKAYSRHF